MDRPKSPFHHSGETPGSGPTDPTLHRGSRISEPAGIGERYGKFACVEKLGAGGMGEVWKAWDSDLMRWVALKFLKGDDTEVILRFQREAQLAAGLSHPHIAAVYDVGHANGRHYIAMQFVDGKTLKHPPSKDRKAQARLIRDAARAVAVANGRGIIHRDLKPENIMVDGGGHVFVMDFGLARSVEGGPELSVSGEILGTPGYMPPEQARSEKVDERADVYGLGGTLYQVLTGRAPFRGANVLDTLHKVLDEDPVPPRKIDPKIDPDLETIVLKCLEKDPYRRYATASELADDLDRWIEGEAIAAHRPSMVYRLRKSMAKRKALVGVGMIGIAGIAIALAILLPRLRSSQGEIQLWGRISGLMAQADSLGRAGEIERSHAKLDEGIRTCREFLKMRDLAIAHYFLARLLVARRDSKGARASLDHALQLDPGLGEAHFERGILRVDEYADEFRATQWLVQGQGSKRDSLVAERRNPRLGEMRKAAIADLSAAEGRSSYFNETDEIFGTAELDRVRGRYDQAGRGLRRVLELDPLYVRALVSLADLAIEEERFDDALAFASQALERDRSCAEAYLRRCDVRVSQAKFDFALADCVSALRIIPGDPVALFHRGYATLQRGDAAGSIPDFDAAIRGNPHLSVAWMNRGLARFQMKELTGAIEDFTEGLRLFPESGGLLNNRGTALEALGRRDEALADFTEAVRVAPHLAFSWANRVELLLTRGKLEPALADCDEGLRHISGNAILLGLRGHIRRALGEYAGALQDLNEAIAKMPQNWEARCNRGMVHARRGETEAAAKDFDDVIGATTGSFDAWMGRAELRNLKNDVGGAMSDIDQALRIDPTHSHARSNRGLLRHRKGDIDGALADWSAVIRANPDYENAYLNRGTTLQERRDFKGALLDFNELIRLAPGNPDYRIQRAHVRFLTGDMPGMEADLKSSLESAPAGWPRRAEVEQTLRNLKNQ